MLKFIGLRWQLGSGRAGAAGAVFDRYLSRSWPEFTTPSSPHYHAKNWDIRGAWPWCLWRSARRILRRRQDGSGIAPRGRRA